MPNITLKTPQLRCDIRPDLGGCIAGLWHHDTPVLRSTQGDDLQSVRQSGSFPLVPYSNRQALGQMRWNGVDYALNPNFAPEPHAIHGVGWERVWDVSACDAQSVTLSYAHSADASWPFDFVSVQTIRLDGGALELRISITNTAAVPAPVGLGWHPYFAKHPGTRVAFTAQGRWEMDARKLPTHRLPHAGLDADCATLTVDHCFDGWVGSVHLQDDLLDTRISSDLAQLVVFTTPERDNIAIEPVSHTNNALNLLAQGVASAGSLGVKVLQPQERFEATLRIAVTRR